MTTKNNRENNEFVVATNSYLNLGGPTGLSNASQTQSGLMSKDDFLKLSNLMLPPPVATLSSSDCNSRITGGVLKFKSGDEYLKVESYVRIKQNEDGSTAPIYSLIPLHIHGNTYGIRFSLDVEALSFYLIGQNRLIIKGPIGERGEKGPAGRNGDNYVLSGPRGDRGVSGSIPVSPYTLETENIGTVQVGTTAITDIVPEFLSNDSYNLVVVRQPIGNETISATRIENNATQTKWAVVVANPGVGLVPYYLDIEPLEIAIANRATEYAAVIAKGYEDAVRFWIDTMSELFDSQKTALCCAIENCLSRTKNIEDRRHWETVSATAKPEYSAKRKFRPDSKIQPPDEEDELIDSTHTLRDLYEDIEFCLHPGQVNRPLVDIPCIFDPSDNEVDVDEDAEDPQDVIDQDMEDNGNNTNTGDINAGTINGLRIIRDRLTGAIVYVRNGVPVDNPFADLGGAVRVFNAEPTLLANDGSILVVDTKYNCGYPANGVSIELPEGEYQLKVIDTNAQFVEGFGAPLRIMTISGMASVSSDFVDYGFFETLEESRNRYNDNAILVNHDGGIVKVYIPVENNDKNNGQMIVGIIPKKIILKQSQLKNLKQSEDSNYATYANINIEFYVKDLKYTKDVAFILENDVLIPTKINS